MSDTTCSPEPFTPTTLPFTDVVKATQQLHGSQSSTMKPADITSQNKHIDKKLSFSCSIIHSFEFVVMHFTKYLINAPKWWTKMTHGAIKLLWLFFQNKLKQKVRKKWNKNSHASTRHLQREQPWWGSSSPTAWLTQCPTHTLKHTHTLIPSGHVTVHTPLCTHSLFLSLTAPRLHICFLLNSLSHSLKINIVALTHLQKTYCTNSVRMSEPECNLD